MVLTTQCQPIHNFLGLESTSNTSSILQNSSLDAQPSSTIHLHSRLLLLLFSLFHMPCSPLFFVCLSSVLIFLCFASWIICQFFLCLCSLFMLSAFFLPNTFLISLLFSFLFSHAPPLPIQHISRSIPLWFQPVSAPHAPIQDMMQPHPLPNMRQL